MDFIKQILASLRDPKVFAILVSGLDCIRPCHSERSVAKSNCEAAPSKAKVESRAEHFYYTLLVFLLFIFFSLSF